ncbi:hypothetical protein [Aliikangiella maris]|uniref:Nucleotide modification associated domain-containing protein n=2 Tax=Aliikangiella maris TaxID=3162458 RepID=A0ABV3MV97_9GAMM
MKRQLGLIDQANLESNEKILLKLNYPMFPDEVSLLIKKGKYLVLSTDFYSKLDKCRMYSQSEFPLKSLHWIIDRIENGFWKKPTDGGLSDFERSVSNEFEGEKVGVNVMMHCCAENMHGFNIWNSSRKDYIADIPPHEWNIPDYMLKDGLLDELKKIAAKYS